MTDLEKAFLACTDKRYEDAVKLLVPLAQKGNVMARLKLGVMYRTGKKGVQNLPKDSNAAFIWLHKAAEQGDADAQYNVGMMYYKGEQSAPNLDEARRYLKLAEEQGNAGAIEALPSLFKTAPKLN